jgi:hypothetical protein
MIISIGLDNCTWRNAQWAACISLSVRHKIVKNSSHQLPVPPSNYFFQYEDDIIARELDSISCITMQLIWIWNDRHQSFFANKVARHPATRSIGLRWSVLSAEIANVSEARRPEITVYIPKRSQSSTPYILSLYPMLQVRRRPVQHLTGSPTLELH